MSASRPKPMTGLCGRSAAQSYKENFSGTNFYCITVSLTAIFNIWRPI